MMCTNGEIYKTQNQCSLKLHLTRLYRYEHSCITKNLANE